jgi:hypothetical protein
VIGIPLACAEGVSRSTISDYLTIRPEWIANEIFGLIFHGPTGEEFKIKFPQLGWILNRPVFDAARFTDPMIGAGITNGIKSGIIAGRNVVLRLQGKKDYFEAEIKKEILDEITFHHKIHMAYLKLSNRDFAEIVRIGKKIFTGKTVDNINSRRLVKSILLSSPQLLRIGFKLLF